LRSRDAQLSKMGQTREELGDLVNLRILYAGEPGSAREKAFLEFLAPLFSNVDAIHVAKLDQRTAEPYDVIVADWKGVYTGGYYVDGVDTMPARLSLDFDRPLVMVGAMAGEMTMDLRPKIQWL
jgi:hypothetical protein